MKNIRLEINLAMVGIRDKCWEQALHAINPWSLQELKWIVRIKRSVGIAMGDNYTYKSLWGQTS